MEKDILYLDQKIREKIFQNPNKLLSIIEEKRNAGKKIVFGNGCFDLWHVGHTRYLYSAKSLGDILLIAVNTDESMRRIKSNRQKPITPNYTHKKISGGHKRKAVLLTYGNDVNIKNIERPVSIIGIKDYILEILATDWHRL